MINPQNSEFELTILFGKSVLFSFERVDRSRMPAGVFLYELRQDNKDPSRPSTLEKRVQNDFFGSILSKDPIELTSRHSMPEHGQTNVGLRSISAEEFRIDDFSVATVSDYLDGQFELTPEPEKSIRVLIVEPWSLPQETVIDNTLQAKQQVVGGMIEAIYPFEDPMAALVCNEEGKLIGLPLNRRVGRDIIAGTFIICGVDDRNANFSSLSDEQIRRYSEQFSIIEIYGIGRARPATNQRHSKRDNHERS